VRYCITTVTRFVAMAILPSRLQVFSQVVRPIEIASPKFNHLILQPRRMKSSTSCYDLGTGERLESAFMASDVA
jgi:hypothetical protein